ncbi:MAG: TIGR00266 family protein [Syntrophomonadales bacterium]|jgi:uncharacterized protein (TIGR00266 family)
MNLEILHRPSYSLAVLKLNHGEGVQAEAGAMVSMTPSIKLVTEMKGGFLGSLKRKVLGGESFFVSNYVAESGPGEVSFAPTVPGDIVGLNLKDESYFVQSGSYLAGDMSLNIDTKFGGGRSFFSGEGLFLLKISGRGILILTSYGAILEKVLAPGEKYIVDTSHIVAFESTVNYRVKKAASGIVSSIVSGEGLVCEYEGPGKVYIQTRSTQSLINWLIPLLPPKQG